MIKENFHYLKDQEGALELLKKEMEIYRLKKQKLKLGAIVFEIKETIFGGIPIWEDVDIRYIRQDNTDADELKIENRLKAIGWKWDFKNVAAFCIVIFMGLCEIYTYLEYWYRKYLPALAFRSEHFDYILKAGFEWTLTPFTFGILKQRFAMNYWLVEVLTDFCIYFNIIF